jgi:hypothetical protein
MIPEIETMTSILQQFEAWIERAKGRHLPCPQIRAYPHFDYVCNYDEQCEGCMIVAAALELKRSNSEKSQLRGSKMTTESDELTKLRAFFQKHALGALSRPSCLVCGQPPKDWPPGIQHAELPEIVVCTRCRDAGQRAAHGKHAMTTSQPDSLTSNEKCTCHYEAPEHCKHHGPLLKVSAPVSDPLRDQDKIQRLLRLLDRYTEMGIGTVAGVLQEARNIIGPAHETPVQLTQSTLDGLIAEADKYVLPVDVKMGAATFPSEQP